MKINVFKSNIINEYDYFYFNNNQHKVALEDKNIYSDKFILLYIYVLPKMLAHGFKVGMTEVKRGESFWGAIKSRIDKQENEVGLHSEGLFDDRYEKYGLDREVVFWGVSVKDNNDQFKDHAIHREITERLPGYSEKHQEWFTGSIVLEDIIDIFNNYRNKKT